MLCKHRVSGLPPLGNWGYIPGFFLEELRDLLDSTKEGRRREKGSKKRKKLKEGRGRREEEGEEEGERRRDPAPMPSPRRARVKAQTQILAIRGNVDTRGTPSGSSDPAKHQAGHCPLHCRPA